MATCRDVIYRAYRMAGIVPLTDDPSAEELEQGLAVLQNIYDRIADSRAYSEVYETGTVEAEEGQRIQGATSVTLPVTVTDWTGRQRKPRDLAFVQYDTGSGMQTYVSDRGTWVQLTTLAAGSDAPFAGRGQEGLSALVALELSETYPGATVGPVTAQKARRWQSIWTRQDTIEPEYY